MNQGSKVKFILPDGTEMEFFISHKEETKIEYTAIKTGEKMVQLAIAAS